MKFGSAEYEIAQSLDASSLNAKYCHTLNVWTDREYFFVRLCREYLLYTSFDSSEALGRSQDKDNSDKHIYTIETMVDLKF